MGGEMNDRIDPGKGRPDGVEIGDVSLVAVDVRERATVEGAQIVVPAEASDSGVPIKPVAPVMRTFCISLLGCERWLSLVRNTARRVQRARAVLWAISALATINRREMHDGDMGFLRVGGTVC